MAKSTKWAIGYAGDSPGTRLIELGGDVVAIRLDAWDSVGATDATDAVLAAHAEACRERDLDPTTTRCFVVGLPSAGNGPLNARALHPSSLTVKAPFEVLGAILREDGLVLVVDGRVTCGAAALWTEVDAISEAFARAYEDESAGGGDETVDRRMRELGIAEIDEPTPGFTGPRH